MRMSKEALKSMEHQEGEKPRDVTKTLGESTFHVLKRVFGTLPSKPDMKTRAAAVEWALSFGAALGKGVETFVGSASAVKLPQSQKDRKTLLEALKEPALAGVIFLNALAGASPAGAETMKKKIMQDAQTQHERVIDMKNDPGIGQFIPESKPHEAILYNASEHYEQLKEWKARHPQVKRIEVSEFRAAVKHTHDDVKRTHQAQAEVRVSARVYFKDGSKRTVSVMGTGEGLPKSLAYSSFELNQKFGEAFGGKSTPDFHKQKGPLYSERSEVSEIFIGMPFAKKDAMKKLFIELDAITSEPKKSK